MASKKENIPVDLNWVFCNICFTMYDRKNPEVKIYLVNCKHIICGKCLKPSSADTDASAKCPVCNKDNRFTLINKSMPDSMKVWFHAAPSDLEDILFLRVTEFQHTHRDHLAKKILLAEKMMPALDAEIKRLKEQGKNLMRVNAKIGQEMEEVCKELKDLKKFNA